MAALFKGDSAGACGTVKLVLVRHGETFFNREGKLQGQLDTELSDLGHQQAAITGEFLRKEFGTFCATVSSDLKRAHDTAKAIVADNNSTDQPQVPTDVRLRELALGMFQGKTTSELKSDQDLKGYWQDFLNDQTSTTPGGESRVDQLTRCGEALDEFAIKVVSQIQQKPRVALVVSHGGSITSLFRHINNLDVNASAVPHSGNCAISIVDCTVEYGCISHWKIISWGRTHHLQSLQSASTTL